MSATHESQKHESQKTDGGSAPGVRKAAHKAGQEAKAEGGRLRDEAMETVRRRADEQKHIAGSYLHTVASAASSGAEAFRRDGLTSVGSMLESAASELDRFADRLDERPADQILRDVEGFARRHPAMFFGSAFLLAFGATRLLKSSAPTDDGGNSEKAPARSAESAAGASPGASTAVVAAPAGPSEEVM